MTREEEQKYEALLTSLRALGSAAVAFSGGVDSTLLLRAARDALGERAAAFTIRSALVPARETAEAEAFCRAAGVRHILVDADPLQIPGFDQNPKDRCYLCKTAMFSRILEEARAQGFAAVVDGTNADDAHVYRPGLRALGELGVVSPLREAGLTKEEIRGISRQLGLPTWDKPAYACLATRFPYGSAVTREKLAMVERAEDFLIARGFSGMRVRTHDGVARIELPAAQMKRALDLREEIVSALKSIGFRYVTLDLEGFRSGSMDEGAAQSSGA